MRVTYDYMNTLEEKNSEHETTIKKLQKQIQSQCETFSTERNKLENDIKFLQNVVDFIQVYISVCSQCPKDLAIT